MSTCSWEHIDASNLHAKPHIKLINGIINIPVLQTKKPKIKSNMMKVCKINVNDIKIFLIQGILYL